MNDFTKKELESIAINLCCNEKTSDILNKINFMIENYCEHKNVYIDYDHNPERCKKCLEIVE